MVLGDSPDLTGMNGVGAVDIGTACWQKRAMRIELPGVPA
jgi:hypothetical protein